MNSKRLQGYSGGVCTTVAVSINHQDLSFLDRLYYGLGWNIANIFGFTLSAFLGPMQFGVIEIDANGKKRRYLMKRLPKRSDVNDQPNQES